MDRLIELKKKYNAALLRNKKAEEYLNTHEPEEYWGKIFKGKTILNGFDEIVIELSLLRLEIEILLYRDMTQEEILNGFKV